MGSVHSAVLSVALLTQQQEISFAVAPSPASSNSIFYWVETRLINPDISISRMIKEEADKQ